MCMVYGSDVLRKSQERVTSTSANRLEPNFAIRVSKSSVRGSHVGDTIQYFTDRDAAASLVLG